MASGYYSGIDTTQRFAVQHGCIFANNRCLGFPPTKRDRVNVSRINGRVYCNGYEYTEAGWRRSVRAMIHDLF